MNPIVHAELSWLMSQKLQARRDRVLVTLAGVVPDLDGLTLVGGTELYGEYHHVLTHGFPAALATAALFGWLGRERLWVAGLSLLAFHLHLLCDLAGSGPGWPILYFWPLDRHEWFWAGQWDLASWQNTVIGLAATLASLACALRWRRTPVELFSPSWDGEVVRTIHQRFRVEPQLAQSTREERREELQD